MTCRDSECVTASVALVLIINGRSILSQARAAELPKVGVSHVRRVFHNGEHNAFTDLIRFRERFYLTFRSCPDGHAVHPTSSIIILASEDAQNWQQVHRFHVEKRDTRDPHFLVFRDKLFVYTGTWYSGDGPLPREDYDLNLHLGFAVWSENGAKWNGPSMLEGTFGHYVWHANSFAGKAYLCGRRKHDFAVGPKGEGRAVESVMLESDDGLIWRKRAALSGKPRGRDGVSIRAGRDGCRRRSAQARATRSSCSRRRRTFSGTGATLAGVSAGRY